MIRFGGPYAEEVTEDVILGARLGVGPEPTTRLSDGPGRHRALTINA
jgi:hypothetical protein